ncbi:MAG: T9SS type A sorting domain-containing protein [Fluviicola sp.]
MKKNYFLLGLLVIPMTMQAQDRVSVVETFTSSTCPPCNPGNQQLESILSNGQNDDNTVSIKYQLDWPGSGDPYFTVEGGDRADGYGVSGVPSSYLDGQTSLNPNNLTQGDLDVVHAVAPKALISGIYQIDVATQTVSVDVDVEMLENTPPGVRLYMAIFEYETTGNVASNGETQFEHVMKKMINGVGGVVMSPMMAGEVYNWTGSYTFEGNYRLPANANNPIDHSIEHSVEEFSDLGVAIWVQTLLDRSVYQAAYAVPGVVGVDENPNTIASAELYPNPSSTMTTVAIQSIETQDITLELINTHGQILSAETLKDVPAGRTTHNLNIAELANGMYTVRISSESGLVSKRLVVQH